MLTATLLLAKRSLTCCKVGLTLSMDAIIAFVLFKFYTTRNIPAPNANPPRTSPWAKNTSLWPAFLLLSSSTLTFFIDVVSLIAGCVRACKNHDHKRATKVEGMMSVAGPMVFVAKWIAVAVLYRVGKTSKVSPVIQYAIRSRSWTESVQCRWINR